MIQIPENTYVAPTEVREDVMEKLVKTFLAGCEIVVASYNDKFVHKWIWSTPLPGYSEFPFDRDIDKRPQDIRMRSCEVKKALMMLKEKKWNVWVYRSYDMTCFWVTKMPKTLRYRGALPATQQDIDEIDID